MSAPTRGAYGAHARTGARTGADAAPAPAVLVSVCAQALGALALPALPRAAARGLRVGAAAVGRGRGLQGVRALCAGAQRHRLGRRGPGAACTPRVRTAAWQRQPVRRR
eukprot:648990-Pleurochrysis_carterae.AAC.2